MAAKDTDPGAAEVVLRAFGHAVLVSSTCSELLVALSDDFAAYRSSYVDNRGQSRVHVRVCDSEAEYSSVREIERDRAYGAWPLVKCRGEVLYDAGPDKTVIACAPDVRKLSQEIEWVATRLIYRQLPGHGVALHSSSVAHPSGIGIGFVGASGSGKSTLAALFLSCGWRLVAEETSFVTLDGVPAVAGWPTPINVEPENLALVRRLTGVAPTVVGGRLDPFRAAAGASETTAPLRLLVFPTLHPERPLAISTVRPGEDVRTQLIMRWIAEDIYPRERAVADDWVDRLLDQVPVARVDGRIDSLRVVDELGARAAV